MSKENNSAVKVVVRVRPLNENEQGPSLTVDHFQKYVKFQEDKVFTFDYVADSNIKQVKISLFIF